MRVTVKALSVHVEPYGRHFDLTPEQTLALDFQPHGDIHVCPAPDGTVVISADSPGMSLIGESILPG